METPVGECLQLVLDEEKIREEREDVLDALKQLGANLSHYDLSFEQRWWRLTSLCERERWKTAPREWTPTEIAKRLQRVLQCCPNGKMVWPLATLREIERYGGLRRVRTSTRQAIIARDGLICGICRLPLEEREVHIDHIVPVSRGGDSHPLNLQVTHRTCNLRKGILTWDEMRQESAK